ncbi:MAG: glycerol-3-phosphate 1-O-acyltransferase PlsY, partial [Candidatus Omnitrophota bacterium]
MILFFSILAAYLLGSVPTGFVIAALTKKVDIRAHGSGNVGATNVFRVAGKAAAIGTLIGDILKGTLAVTLIAALTYRCGTSLSYQELAVLLGCVVVAGHIYSIFLNFKGGKGVATSAGVLVVLCPKLLGIGLAVFILIFICTRIVSIGSILSSLSIVAGAYLFSVDPAIRFLNIVLAVMIIARHK